MKESLSSEAKTVTEEIRTIQKDVDYRKLLEVVTMLRMISVIIKYFKELFRDLYLKRMTIDDAEMKHDEFNLMLGVLINYAPKNQKYIDAKKNLLDNVKNFYEGRQKIIEGFKNGIFLLKSDDEFEGQQTSKKSNKKEPPKKPIKTDANEFNGFIIKKETGINKELFKNYFGFQAPTEMFKTLYNISDRKKNNLLVNTIKSGLSDLKNKIKKMSEDEIKIEKPNEVVDIVEEILEFNEQNQEG